MRISDWSSDVCSSDLGDGFRWRAGAGLAGVEGAGRVRWQELAASVAPAGIARRHPYARPQALAGAAEAASFPRAPPRNAPSASKQRAPPRQAGLRPVLLAVVVPPPFRYACGQYKPRLCSGGANQAESSIGTTGIRKL